MRKIGTSNPNPEITAIKRQAQRHVGSYANARRDLAVQCADQVEHRAALEDALDEIRSSHQGHGIRRWVEMGSLAVLGAAEVVVAENVVQALGLTATNTRLVAVAVGGSATALAWLAGHEWAMSRDPRVVLAGRRGWLRLATAASGTFLAANLGVRIYYGFLTEKVNHYGNGLVAPVLSGLLLTAVTAALMIVAAYVSAHAESPKVAHIRARIRQARRAIRPLQDAGAPRITGRDGLRPVADEERPPAA